MLGCYSLLLLLIYRNDILGETHWVALLLFSLNGWIWHSSTLEYRKKCEVLQNYHFCLTGTPHGWWGCAAGGHFTRSWCTICFSLLPCLCYTCLKVVRSASEIVCIGDLVQLSHSGFLPSVVSENTTVTC
jgi:hypothetical protein